MTKLCAACHNPMLTRTGVLLDGTSMGFIGCMSEPEDCDQSILKALPPADFIAEYFTDEAQSRLFALIERVAIYEVSD